MSPLRRIESFATSKPLVFALIYSALSTLALLLLIPNMDPDLGSSPWRGAVFGLVASAIVLYFNARRSRSENHLYLFGSIVAGALLPPMAIGWSGVEAYRAARSRPLVGGA